MIRKFERSDLRRIKSNNFSKTRDIGFVFDDDDFLKQTLTKDGNVYAIICFKSYWKNNFIGFFLIGEDMPAICARELKDFVDNLVVDLNIERIQTDSVDTEILNKWHYFLGFTLEGTMKKMIFDNDYNMWGFLKGRDF